MTVPLFPVLIGAALGVAGFANREKIESKVKELSHFGYEPPYGRPSSMYAPGQYGGPLVGQQGQWRHHHHHHPQQWQQQQMQPYGQYGQPPPPPPPPPPDGSEFGSPMMGALAPYFQSPRRRPQAGHRAEFGNIFSLLDPGARLKTGFAEAARKNAAARAARYRALGLDAYGQPLAYDPYAPPPPDAYYDAGY